MRVLSILVSGALIGLAVVGSSHAQIASAVVVGRVTDTSQAVMPGAEVEMKRLATNELFRTLTTETGDYTLPNLPIDTYELRVSMPGFRPDSRRHNSGDWKNCPHRHPTQSGRCERDRRGNGRTLILKTESSELGQVVSNKVVVGLPVRGRDWMGFVALIPGVAPSRGSYGRGRG